MFTRTHDRLRSSEGLGIGLSLVHSLVTMHGGTVQAASDWEDRGSTFTIRLPLVTGPVDPPDTSWPIPLEGANARVLLVDDNQDAADTAAALLELSGYEVKVAYDPGLAMTILDQFSPQVAVLDIGLPGMSGYELAARVKAHRHGGSCYLVALTGYGTAADLSKAYEAGFAMHLVKPARPEALLEAIEKGLQRA